MSSSKTATITLGAIAAVIAIASAAVWSHLPLSDPEEYFHFADQRIVFGIPRYFDVASNIFYLYISVFSFIFAIQRRHFLEKRIFETFLVLNAGIFLTGWGSSYFHLYPSPETLFWDRLPLALVFASLLTLVLVDRVVFYYHRGLLASLNILAFWSVWKISYGDQDLRTYILVQFGSIIAAVLLVLSFKRGHIRRFYFVVAFLLYGLAKVGEVYDHYIVGSSRVDLQACKLEYSIVSPK